MKSIYVLIGVLALLSLVALGSSLQTKIVESEIEVDYDSSGCLKTCTNFTEGNMTIQNCTNICRGILTITGENLLKEFQIGDKNFHEILENNVIRTLGNETDISSLVSEMEKWREYESKYNLCLNSNRNISTKLLLLEGSENDEIKTLNSQLSAKNSEITNLNKDIEDEKKNKIVYAFFGVVVGILFIQVIMPKIKGEEKPKDDTSELPANPPY